MGHNENLLPVKPSGSMDECINKTKIQYVFKICILYCEQVIIPQGGKDKKKIHVFCRNCSQIEKVAK